MTGGDRDQNRPAVDRARGLPAQSERTTSSSPGTIQRLLRDGIMIGLILAGVGFVFVAVFTISELLWGSYFGTDPGFGRALSAGVMTTGIAIATLVWLGREVGTAARNNVRWPQRLR